jgi:ABC-type sulfate transport system permease component
MQIGIRSCSLTFQRQVGEVGEVIIISFLPGR